MPALHSQGSKRTWRRETEQCEAEKIHRSAKHAEKRNFYAASERK
jgi:hypothetical protein